MQGNRYSPEELFAFNDKPITITDSTAPVNLIAYIETPKSTVNTIRNTRDQNKVLKFTTSLEGPSLDLINPLQLIFDRKITSYDSSKIVLANKDFIRQPFSLVPDTSATRLSILHNWVPNTAYNLIIAKDAFTDSAGATLPRADTLTFTTRKEEDYGSLKIRFNNLDVSKNPVLQIVQGDLLITSAPLTQRDYVQKLFKPGDYQLRILYDENKNGRWDAGEFFGKHKQPEIVINLQSTISVRANWDNEKEISL
jgi:hypothetical protein